MNKTYKEFLNEASGIADQLELLKNDNSEWAITLKSWLLQNESPFDASKQGLRFQKLEKKAVPKEIKMKYPDLIFILQAIRLHMDGYSYFKEWEKAKAFLKFKVKYNKITAYRFWHVSSSSTAVINNESFSALLTDKKPIKLASAGFMSYTRHSKLFSSSGVLNIGTEEALQTNGGGTFIVTKHSFVPIFDLYYYLVHFLNRVKRVFSIKIDDLKKKYPNLFEKEIIGPSISSITFDDVIGYYENGMFFNKNDKPLVVRNTKFSNDKVKTIKDSLEKYGKIDYMMNNSLCLTTNPKTSSFSMYVKKWELEKDLSSIIGVDVFSGIW